MRSPNETEGLSTIVVVFVPQPDITAYELALILPHLISVPLKYESWAALGAAQRHFQASQQPTKDPK